VKGKIVLVTLFCFFGIEFVFAQKVYTVKSRDTLWSIAGKFYNHPEEWKKIADANPKIKDPHWIYPGEELTIPGIEQAVAVEQKVVKEPTPVEKTEEVAPKEIVPVEKKEEKVEVSTVTPVILEKKEKVKITSGSFLAPKDWAFDGYITGEQKNKVLISAGDIVYLDIGSKKGLKPKMRCGVYRKGDKVFHPKTGKLVGQVIQNIAVLELTEHIQDNTSTARVLKSFEPIKIGDWVKIISE